MRLYCLERGVNVVGGQVDQQAVDFVLDVDRILFACLGKAAAGSAFRREHHIAIRIVGLDVPAKDFAVELARRACVGGGNLDMHNGMA